MSASTSNLQQCTFHLQCLDRFLQRLGTFGTALIDPDEAVDDIWSGLLVWNIAEDAKNGIMIRCHQALPGGAWRYCHDNGTVIAGVYEHLKIVPELTAVLLPSPTTLASR